MSTYLEWLIAILLAAQTAAFIIFLAARYFYLKIRDVADSQSVLKREKVARLSQYLDEEKYLEAKRDADELLAGAPAFSQALWYRGQANFHLQDFEGARADFEKLAKIRPDWDCIDAWIDSTNSHLEKNSEVHAQIGKTAMSEYGQSAFGSVTQSVKVVYSGSNLNKAS